MERIARRVVITGAVALTLMAVTMDVATQAAGPSQEAAAAPGAAAAPEASAAREVTAGVQEPAAVEVPTTVGVTGALEVPTGSGAIGGWLVDQRDRLQSVLEKALRQYRSGARARLFFMIFGVAFLYGLLHALLPGHRKTLLVAYFLAEDTEPHRGIIAGVGLAALQGIAAVIIVFSASGLLASSVPESSVPEAAVPQAAVPEAAAPEGVERIGAVIDLVGSVGAALIGLLGLVLTAIKVREAAAARHHHQEERILSKLKTVSDDIDPDHHDPAREMIYDHRRAGRRRRIREGVLFPAMLIAGILPSSGTAVLMVTAVALGTVGLGLLGAVAMVIGMAVTLTVIAVGTIGLRSRLLLLLRSRVAHIVRVILELAAALLVLAFGVTLLIPLLG